jgi:uncharacterized membrane protein YfcA
VPTLITHWVRGHIDWSVSAAFAGGAISGAAVGSRLAPHVQAQAMKRSFGLLLIGFAIYIVTHQLLTH